MSRTYQASSEVISQNDLQVGPIFGPRICPVVRPGVPYQSRCPVPVPASRPSVPSHRVLVCLRSIAKRWQDLPPFPSEVVPSQSRCPVPLFHPLPSASDGRGRGEGILCPESRPVSRAFAGDLFPGAWIRSRAISTKRAGNDRLPAAAKLRAAQGVWSPIRVVNYLLKIGDQTTPTLDNNSLTSVTSAAIRPRHSRPTRNTPFQRTEKSLSPFSHKIAIPPRSVFYAWIIFRDHGSLLDRPLNPGWLVQTVALESPLFIPNKAGWAKKTSRPLSRRLVSALPRRRPIRSCTWEVRPRAFARPRR
jgi:hypothetical protein